MPGRSIMPPAVAILFLLGLAAVFLASQNSAPSPVPEASPSPSPSPSITPKISPTPTPLPGAQNFHQWGSITVFNGLPSDSVRAIAQTPDGVMWFGTDNGLARFDGRRIQNFSLGGVDADRIFAMKAIRSGELLIGTRAGAFIYFDSGFHLIEGTQNLAVTSILLGENMLLGTEIGLVLRVERTENGESAAAAAIPNPIRGEDGGPIGVTSLAVNDANPLVATHGRGAFVLKDGSISELASSPRPLFVNSLARDFDGGVWLGTDAAKGVSGIYLARDGERIQRITAPTAKVLALEVNESGLWAGTERYGLFHVTEGKLKKNLTFANTSGGLRSDTIYALFTDREGVIWIGTNRGVSRFDREGSFQETVSDIPNSNFIRTLYQVSGEEGSLYAGSNRGLFTLDPRKEVWNEVPAFKNKVIYAIRKRYGSSIVIGTPDGLFDLSGRRLLAGDVRSLAGYNVRDYAAVFGKGVYDITSDVPKLVAPDPSVTSIGEKWNKLWIGTLDRGLLSFTETGVVTEAEADKLKSGTIWGISNIQNGTATGPAYIAGQHGVYAIPENGDIEQIIQAEDVRDVVDRHGHIWAASTTRGLLHARRDDRFGWLVSELGFEQGFPSEKAFAIQPAGDSLIVATNRGVVTYRPGTIAPMLIPVRILSQRVHDLAEARSTIPLEYPQNSLLVEVAGQSSRTFPEEFQYAFVLKNSKGEEVSRQLSNDPQYAPADLKPGDYAIEAIAFNRDLLASDPLVVRFSVGNAPFPWTATALGFLLAIAVVALVWAVVERRRIVLRNRELAAARLDLANEAERERSRIARDLHDQTLADLRGLLMKSDKELPADAGFREDIESISTEIRRICEDLSPSVLENVGLIAALEFLLNHTIENYSFDHGEATDEDVGLPVSVQLQIYRIAQEVLANIKQHAGAKIVKMKVAVPGRDSFELTIDNDGANFVPPEHNLRGGRGIGGIRSRAAMIRSHVEWTTAPEGHPRFVLTIGRGDDAA